MRTTLVALGTAAAALLSACDGPLGFGCDAELSLRVIGSSGDTVNTSSGLRYLELEAGSGRTVAGCDLVTTEFTGRLESGAVFAQSSTDLLVGSGVHTRGLELGLVGMRVAGRRRLIVPPRLGYGASERRDASGAVIVPANSTLIYDVLVVEVEN